METNMAEIDTLRAGRHEWVGEIGRPVVRPTRPDDIPVDVWPGKRTDLASLERNAEAWRREERRQAMRVFFKLLFRRMFRRD
jgi:hypothetical protein